MLQWDYIPRVSGYSKSDSLWVSFYFSKATWCCSKTQKYFIMIKYKTAQHSSQNYKNVTENCESRIRYAYWMWVTINICVNQLAIPRKTIISFILSCAHLWANSQINNNNVPTVSSYKPQLHPIKFMITEPLHRILSAYYRIFLTINAQWRTSSC